MVPPEDRQDRLGPQLPGDTEAEPQGEDAAVRGEEPLEVHLGDSKDTCSKILLRAPNSKKQKHTSQMISKLCVER